jgi:hypothetical protein
MNSIPSHARPSSALRSDAWPEGEGRTLLVRGATGQPAHLVALITEFEAANPVLP